MKPEEAVKFWLEQSKLMWSRVQTASVIEAAALAGWYKLLRDNQLGTALVVLVLGAGLLVVVGLLMYRDSQYMVACERVAGDQMPQPSPPLFGLSGRRIAVGSPLLLASCNIVLAFTMKCFA
jgi:hypothetical protein